MTLLNKNKFNGELLENDGKTYMCAYLGMNDNDPENTIYKFMINGNVKSVSLNEDDVMGLAEDANGYYVDNLYDAQGAVEDWIKMDVAEFVNYWELYC